MCVKERELNEGEEHALWIREGNVRDTVKRRKVRTRFFCIFMGDVSLVRITDCAIELVDLISICRPAMRAERGTESLARTKSNQLARTSLVWL